jgi:glucose/arabinose dehydrogenase
VPKAAHLKVVAKHLRNLRGVLVGPGGVTLVAASGKVYKIVPGHAPTVYATGFTNIIDVAFDRWGNLYVLEIAGSSTGALIKVAPNGHRTEIAAGRLHTPGGLGIGYDGSIYVSVNSTSPTGGDLVKVSP